MELRRSNGKSPLLPGVGRGGPDPCASAARGCRLSVPAPARAYFFLSSVVATHCLRAQKDRAGLVAGDELIASPAKTGCGDLGSGRCVL